MRLDISKIYKISDGCRIFYVKIIDELCNWEYDYNTYRCEVLSQGEYFGETLILVTEMWDIFEISSLEMELL